jgi:dATP pyrophosphohydrolase
MPSIVSTIVEVIVFRIERDVPEFLLLRRSDHDALYPGMWQILTGSVHAAETGNNAAVRELREETGLLAERFWVVPHVGAFYDHQQDAVHLTPFFAAQVRAGIDPTLSTEHSAHAWLPFRDALRLLAWPSQQEGVSLVHEVILRGEAGSRLARVW